MGCCSSSPSGGRSKQYALEDGEFDITGQPIPPPAQQQSPAKAAKPSNAKPTASAGTSSPPVKGTTGGIANYNSSKPKLDPKDFQFVGLTGETKIKLPGSINGQAFTLDKCEDCDIYLLDACAQVTIDECKNCRIFIGPTEGSVFIRDCISSKFGVVCRQLRTRDCKSCQISLLCRTRPVVESSTNLGFGCYDLDFKQLDGLMQKVKLGPFHNFWSHIFDFTPKDGNWRILPAGAEISTAALLAPLPEEAKAVLDDKPPAASVYVTHGEREPLPSGEYLFVLFPPKCADAAADIAQAVSEQGQLLRTNRVALNAESAAQVAGEAGWGKPAQKDLAAAGTCVGLELMLPADGVAGIQDVVAAAGGFTTDAEGAAAAFRYMGVDG